MTIICELDDHLEDLRAAAYDLANKTRILGASKLGAYGEGLMFRNSICNSLQSQ